MTYFSGTDAKNWECTKLTSIKECMLWYIELSHYKHLGLCPAVSHPPHASILRHTPYRAFSYRWRLFIPGVHPHWHGDLVGKVLSLGVLLQYHCRFEVKSVVFAIMFRKIYCTFLIYVFEIN